MHPSHALQLVPAIAWNPVEVPRDGASPRESTAVAPHVETVAVPAPARAAAPLRSPWHPLRSISAAAIEAAWFMSALAAVGALQLALFALLL